MKETIIYKTSPQYSIKADFHDCGVQNAPVIVYIHGGGLIWGSRNDLANAVIELYLRNGFSIFSIDYRLAPISLLPEILEDIKDALLWIQNEASNNFSINPDKIAVIGASAGGFLALSTGLFINKPQAIVSFYGYGDISAPWATAPSSFYLQKTAISLAMKEDLVSKDVNTEAKIQDRFLVYLSGRQTGEWVQDVTGLHPHYDKEALKKISPLYQVDESFPATLLLHGTRDNDVPYEQSVIMKEKLAELKVNATLFTIPEGDHVFDSEFHKPIVQEAFQEVISFLKEQLS